MTSRECRVASSKACAWIGGPPQAASARCARSRNRSGRSRNRAEPAVAPGSLEPYSLAVKSFKEMTAETWQPPACKVPDLSIWPAGGAPSRARTQKPLVTGDQDFDRAVTVYARDPLYLGVLSDEPLENLKELVVTHGVTCENGRFAVETARLGLIERMDLEYIAEMFDSPRDVLERWLRYDALAHSNPTV